MRFFYGEILHVIPKVLSCFFGTKKIDFLKFGVSVGDKMAERAAPVSTLRCFYGYAVSEFLVLTHVSKFVGLTVSQHCSLDPILKAIKAFKDLKACGGNSVLSSC